MATISFPVTDEDITLPVTYGYIYYMVERDNRKYFSARCPSCGDSRKISYKGVDGQDYEADCPVCNSRNGWGNHITIHRYIIWDYTVYKVELLGSDSKRAYSKGQVPPMHIYHMSAFHKTGNGYNNMYTMDVPTQQSSWDNIPKDLDDSRCFTKKKDAEELRKLLIERDKKLLAEFNEKYGTDFEYPYE